MNSFLCQAWMLPPDLLDLISFVAPASTASASLTALALNAGSKKAAEWFYLSDASKSQAAHAIKYFEDRTRISLSAKKAPVFCSTILYLQGAALAIQGQAALSPATHADPLDVVSVSSTVTSLLASYPTALGYQGYCIHLFPSPTWRSADPPCEGVPSFPEEDVTAGVSLFSLKCLAAGDFDWRTTASGYRPGGVSALTNMFSIVRPASAASACSREYNSELVTRIFGMVMQLLFTQLMVGPVSAMLTMEVKLVCAGAFEGANCLQFENLADIFFESLNAAQNLAAGIDVDAQCLLFRSNKDPFSLLAQAR